MFTFTNSFSDSAVVPVIVSCYGGSPGQTPPSATDPVPLSDFLIAQTSDKISVPVSSTLVQIFVADSGYYSISCFQNRSSRSVNVYVVESTYYFIFSGYDDTGCTFMTEDDWYIYLFDADPNDTERHSIHLNASLVRFDFGN